MKPIPMLKYIFSFWLLSSSFSGFGQEIAKDSLIKKETKTDKIVQAPTDTTLVSKTNRFGLRLGIDLFKTTRFLYDKNYEGIEITGDYRLTKKMYLAAELGNENKTTDDTRLNFTTKGTFLKVGIDYNFYKNWLDMENAVYVGLRYGASTFSQELNSYRIYNPNPYFGELPALTSGKKFDGLTASWAEVVMGIKAKLINNLYAGFSFRLNVLMTNKKPDNFDNLYIPGFNRTYDGNFGVGFNYTLSYFLPIYKTTSKVKK